MHRRFFGRSTLVVSGLMSLLANAGCRGRNEDLIENERIDDYLVIRKGCDEVWQSAAGVLVRWAVEMAPNPLPLNLQREDPNTLTARLASSNRTFEYSVETRPTGASCRVVFENRVYVQEGANNTLVERKRLTGGYQLYLIYALDPANGAAVVKRLAEASGGSVRGR